MLRLAMLQSVIATVNRTGLQSLRIEDDVLYGPRRLHATHCSVWAVIDSRSLLPIHRHLVSGERFLAFQLLLNKAKWAGPITL